MMSQIDLATGICAGQCANSRVVTVAVEAMSFLQRVHVGYALCVYTSIGKIGRTSLTIHVEAWAQRDRIGQRDKVTEADFKFVALDSADRPTPISRLDIMASHNLRNYGLSLWTFVLYS